MTRLASVVHAKSWEVWNAVPSKDDALCCNAKRDKLGRLPIGFCGPDCERRPQGREKTA